MTEKKGVSFSGSGKNRIMLFIAIVVVAILVGIGYWQSKNTSPGPVPAAMVAEAPKIDSTPGVGRAPPREYIKLQQEQNAQEVAEAQKKGTSAVPTIIRASYLGDDVNKGNVDTDNTKGGVSGCDLTSLSRAKQAGVSAVELRCKGCSAAALRAAGYTAGELRDAGFTAAQLNAAGFTAKQLKDAGFTAEDLKTASFTVKDLMGSGFSASELKKAGFTSAQIKQAGFSAGQLKDAGFSAEELKAAGFVAKDLVDAGFSAAELKKAGFSNSELKAAGFSASDLARAECSSSEIKRLRASGAPVAKLKEMGCSGSALRAAGYSIAEVKAAGFSAQELKSAGFTAAELKDAGFSAKELRDSGFSAKELKTAGFNAKDLKDAGYGSGELKDVGFSPEELKNSGFSPEELRKAGFTADELKRAGFSAADLKGAGYSDGELARAGVDVPAMNGGQSQSQMGSTAGASAAAPAAQVVSLGGGISTSGAQTDPAAAALERLQHMQAAQASDQERKQKLDQMRQGMTTQANELLSSWSPPTPQLMVMGIPDVAQQGGAAGGVPLAGGTQAGANGQAGQMPPGTYDTIKAGTIMFATLDVGINSDEKSPILATIVEGQLRGAKLIGEFTHSDQDKKVLLSFNLMNLPKLPNSVSLNAVAIDEKTAHTMLADRVDSHYLLRYGTLFASSFISGLADAVGKSGSSTTVSPVGVTVSQPTLDTTKLVVTGLGAVGKQYSSSLSSNFTTPVTVYVNPGTGIGILFKTDLHVPKSVDELAMKQ